MISNWMICVSSSGWLPLYAECHISMLIIPHSNFSQFCDVAGSSFIVITIFYSTTWKWSELPLFWRNPLLCVYSVWSCWNPVYVVHHCDHPCNGEWNTLLEDRTSTQESHLTSREAQGQAQTRALLISFMYYNWMPSTDQLNVLQDRFTPAISLYSSSYMAAFTDSERTWFWHATLQAHW